MRWFRAALLTVLTVGGCQALLEPNPSVVATLSMQVGLYPGVRHLSAYFEPGRDRGGTRRSVTAPLVVAGRPVSFPPPSAGQGSQINAIPLGADAASLGVDPIEVVMPRVAGVEADLPVVALTTMAKLNPDTIATETDGSIRIRLAIAPGSPTWRTRSWSVGVSGADGISLSGSGLPPTTLTIPAALLPAPRNGGWSIEVNMSESHANIVNLAQPPPYYVSVWVQQRAYILVRR